MISWISAGTRVAAAGLLALSGTILATPARANGTAASANDERWLISAHQSNLTEIAAGRDAVRYAADADVKRMAEHLVDDHGRMDQRIVALGRKYDVFLPTRPTDAQRDSLAALQGKEGEAYDSLWIRSRIASHQQARTEATQASSNGEAADVAAAARDAGPVLRRHHQDLSRLSGDLGLSAPESVAGGTGGQAAAAAAERSRPATVLAGLGVALLIGAVVAARRGRGARG